MAIDSYLLLDANNANRFELRVGAFSAPLPLPTASRSLSVDLSRFCRCLRHCLHVLPFCQFVFFCEPIILPFVLSSRSEEKESIYNTNL